MTIYKIQGTVWRWPGDAGWHFLTLPKPLAQKIRKMYPKGFVKIRAIIGKSTWETSLFPHREAGYLLCVNKKIRKQEGLFEGDGVVVRFDIL